ncbi:hypothetical protein HanRHA438_Chr10g0430651 [Helianthus annuus]|uniref:Uncharacterized protein n=2 Tax=Helianthus annuus TaxID=4232 RepID=A0A9K3HUM2_HELAN|nr:hypothetical protein HanXRQr2_Chr10g0418901 [Helianthus annuus]KAJ0512287.1 hypothetical protein HanHA300_Chr10g0344491 [Helianthus annuus]KAJ0528398.1 hypothetical protein HanHA89_Chr10g0365901 [Helianthus annuus]KAJ0877634.1 hypothetical protein HanRHA438_Chr10g0430651 [Helianthus annuus]
MLHIIKFVSILLTEFLILYIIFMLQNDIEQICLLMQFSFLTHMIMFKPKKSGILRSKKDIIKWLFIKSLPTKISISMCIYRPFVVRHYITAKECIAPHSAAQYHYDGGYGG